MEIKSKKEIYIKNFPAASPLARSPFKLNLRKQKDFFKFRAIFKFDRSQPLQLQALATPPRFLYFRNLARRQHLDKSETVTRAIIKTEKNSSSIFAASKVNNLFEYLVIWRFNFLHDIEREKQTRKKYNHRNNHTWENSPREDFHCNQFGTTFSGEIEFCPE